MPPYYLTDFETQRFYLIEPQFNGVYSKNNIAKIKDGAYVVNFDESRSIRTHWIALYTNVNNLIHFDSCGIEYIPQKLNKFIGNKTVITNICRIQAHDSIMRGCFCIGFIDFMFKGKSLLD